MKILFRKLRYLLLPVFILELVFSGIAVYLLLQQADETIKEFLSLRIIDSIELLRNAETDMEIVQETYESGALAKCRAIALAYEMGKEDEDMPLVLARLAKTMNVEMYSIINEKGIVELSNEILAIGYDINSREQSREFLPLLTDSASVLIQKPMPRGLDEEMFQYIGIKRLDRKGIVAIGCSLKNYETIESTTSLSRRMQAMRIGERGFVLIVRDNRVIAAEDSSVLNKELHEIGILELGEAGDFFTVKLHGRKYIASYESMDDLVLIGMVPESEGFRIVRRCIFLIIFIQVCVFGLILIVVYNNRVYSKKNLKRKVVFP